MATGEAECIRRGGPDLEEEFDQTGFELPPAPEAAVAPAGQGQLFNDDYTQPDAADGEPVFWTGSVGQTFPADDFVQADMPEGAKA